MLLKKSTNKPRNGKRHLNRSYKTAARRSERKSQQSISASKSSLNTSVLIAKTRIQTD